MCVCVPCGECVAFGFLVCKVSVMNGFFVDFSKKCLETFLYFTSFF